MMWGSKEEEEGEKEGKRQLKIKERRKKTMEDEERRAWNARVSKEELSAVKNHAPRHHCHGQASALHNQALNLTSMINQSFHIPNTHIIPSLIIQINQK